MVYPWWMFHMLVCWRLVVSLPFPSAWEISEVLEMCRNQSGKQPSNPNSPVWSWTLPKKNRHKLVELGILVWFTALDEEWMDLSKPPPRYQATGIAAALGKSWRYVGWLQCQFPSRNDGFSKGNTPKSGLLILFYLVSGLKSSWLAEPRKIGRLCYNML